MNPNIYTLLPYGDDAAAQAQGSRLEAELVEKKAAESLPLWGKLWVKEGKVVCVLPKQPFDEFDPPPILFLDESLDVKRQLFFVGGLIFRPLHAIIAATRYLQNLVVLGQAYEGFWPSDLAPPRMHLWELNNYSARQGTNWKHVPHHQIEMLFKAFIPSVRELSGLKLIAPVDLPGLERSVLKAFPESRTDVQKKQLSIQIASLMLKIMLAEAKLTVNQIEVVADHDFTRISVGKGRRQATLHLLDGLVNGKSLGEGTPDIIWNDQARYTSRFSPALTRNVLETDGFCIRTLVESLGLQFVDAYLGLWRTVNAEKRAHFGIGPDELGVQVISNMVWV